MAKKKADAGLKLRAIQAEMEDAFKEREDQIRGALVALLAKEHVFFLGQPGTAKSAMTRVLARALDDVTYFEWLLGQATTPEEIFGPPDFKALKQDGVYRRVTKGKAPEADIVFLDEIWKANSTVLNSTLSLLNERIFHNADKAQTCPLVSVFAASNELPQDTSLKALYDRIILRYEVRDLADMADWTDVVFDAQEPEIATTLTKDDLCALQDRVANVKVSDDIRNLICELRVELNGEFPASTRRWKKALKCVRAMAVLDGRDEVEEYDLTILADILWNEPKDRAELLKRINMKVNPLGQKAVEVMDRIHGVMEQFRALDDEDDNFLLVASETLAKVKKDRNRVEGLLNSPEGSKCRELQDARKKLDEMVNEITDSISI